MVNLKVNLKKKIETAKKMLLLSHITEQDVSLSAGLSLSQIKDLKNSQKRSFCTMAP